MILFCGSVSLSNWIDAARLTLIGDIVRGNTTNPRTGRIASVPGIAGMVSGPATWPVSLTGAGVSPVACKALKGWALIF
jgi:hypothetical protein